jgi:flagellar hook-associated protein 3 FlgL
MYYDSIYGTNNYKLTQELFDVNKQIASGMKIQYASDDVRTFTETMRLDNEMTVLGEIKTSTENGYKTSNNTDTILTEFNDSMERMKTLLIQAANDTNDEDSLDAIASELRGLEDNLKRLSNTSINGKYLFSGSAVDVKPIAEDGTYQGNDESLNAFLGSNNQQQYNISGAELFLGEESGRKREVSSNVVHENLLGTDAINANSTIAEFMGDKDSNKLNRSHFYLRGTRSDGTAFKDIISLNEDATMQDLLDKIEADYGENMVNVSVNSSGEIVVEDKLKGSSKLDFHMVAAVDYSADYTGVATDTQLATDRAYVDDIDDLDSAETDYESATGADVFVREFSRSGFEAVDDAAQNIEGLVYDRVKFEQNGPFLSSNAPQIVREDNSFASPSTKISEVADLSQGTDGTLAGSSLKLVGTDIYGNDYDVDINFKSSADGGSTFTYNGTEYNIYNVDPDGRTAVDADEMTYQQLMDVVNMVVTNKLPASSPGTADEYDEAITASNLVGNTTLSYDGKLTFKDLTAANTQASIAMYDPNSDNFTTDADGNVTAAASIMTFNTNNALTISDPKTDFFNTLDEVIASVENYKSYPDASKGDPRSVGIENAMKKMDDLMNHVYRIHSKVGAQSNTLNTAYEQTQILEISTMSLRSSVIDTDLAEASLRLSQLDTNYQAMLSTIGKISKLSLVNYL